MLCSLHIVFEVFVCICAWTCRGAEQGLQPRRPGRFVTPLCPSVAAFVPQWRSRAVVTEIIRLASPRYLHLVLCKKRLPAHGVGRFVVRRNRSFNCFPSDTELGGLHFCHRAARSVPPGLRVCTHATVFSVDSRVVETNRF